MPKSVTLGGLSLQGHGGLGAIPLLSIAFPHMQGQRKGASQPQQRGSAGQGSMLRTGKRPRGNHPHGVQHFTYSPMPACSHSICRPATPMSSLSITHL